MTSVSHISHSHALPEPSRESNPLILAVDRGGGGIKTSLLDLNSFQATPPQRTAVQYPFSPEDLLEIIESHAPQVERFERTTLDMPGMVRRDVVAYTPHYIRKAGPRTELDPELETAWSGLGMESVLHARFVVPALVLNDAEVAAAGVVSDEGMELVMTLGTGLGCAFVDGGRLAPRLEISHAQMRWGLVYDDVVGEVERIRFGDSAWSHRVLRTIDTLWPVFRWDRLYIEGGNSSRVSATVHSRLGENMLFISNTAGMDEGVRVWTLVKPHM